VIELTQEQQRALEQGPHPLRLVDPRTKAIYVLLPESVVGHLQAILDNEDFNPREAYPLLDKALAQEDANDPHLHEYQQFTRQRRQ
jgi:hypothetical protein